MHGARQKVEKTYAKYAKKLSRALDNLILEEYTKDIIKRLR